MNILLGSVGFKVKYKIKDTYIKAVVGPAAELHVAVLVVEGEPGDVDLAGRLDTSTKVMQVNTHFATTRDLEPCKTCPSKHSGP